jgi:aldose 1-epimerase
MTISVRAFGEFQGRRVDQFSLVSDTGVEVDIIGYGVAVRDWRVPVPGGLRSVVLGFEEFAHYPAHSPYFGSLAGRVANRIRGASFVLDGQEYRLPANESGTTLHGGPNGLGRQVWSGEIDRKTDAVRFSLSSPDGDEGFPGKVEFTATYSLVGNALRLELEAEPDRPTPISLVQHQYFNLGSGPDILDHVYSFQSGAFTENDDSLIPTGRILPSEGTKWDFQRSRTLRDAGGLPVSYDGNLVLDPGRDTGVPVATVSAPDESLTLALKTDRPGLQFYNGAYTDVPVPGLGGRSYGQYSGFCLEDQAFPDAVHHRHFPSIIHGPGRKYRHWCEIEIA